MLEEIVELHKQGRLEEAESRYRELLVFNPDDPETLHLLGIVRRQRGDLREALTLVQRAVELNPERPPYFMTLAGLELHAGMLEAAERDFRAALALDPNLGGAYSALAQIALAKNDVASAEQQFKLALASGDERVDVLTGYASLLLRRGESEMALRYYTRATEFDPNDFPAQSGLARTFMARGNHAFAEQTLRNLLERRPELHAARRLLAESLLLQKRNQDARVALWPLLETPGERAGGFATLGDVARAEGDHKGAVVAYRQSLELERDQPRVIEAMAWCLTRMGMVREAIAGYREYLEHAPQDLDARRALAQLLAESGDPAGAADSFRAAIDAGGDDAATRQALAATLEMSGELDAAEQEAERVLAENPAAPGAQLVRARAYLRRGQAEFALGVLDPLPDAETNPQGRRFVQMLRGRAADLKGDPAAAVAAWREAHALAGATALPAFASLAGLDAAVARCADAGRGYATQGPVALLLGAPGSCVELVGALLSDAPELAVTSDRFGDQPRGDLFTRPELSRYREPISDDDARIVGRHYERPLQRLNRPRDRRLVDWLPHWDANLLPAIHRVFGPIPLIVAGRDPRDALLQWLALGSPQRASAADPLAAARWLGTAYEHLLWTRDHGRVPVIGVDAISLLEDPAAAAQRIANALGLSGLEPGAQFERARRGLGGMSTALPRGRFRGYESELASAFASFAPLLPRLGAGG